MRLYLLPRKLYSPWESLLISEISMTYRFDPNTKCDINIMRIPERKEDKEQEKKKKQESLRISLKLMYKIKPKIQETQKIPNRKKKKV